MKTKIEIKTITIEEQKAKLLSIVNTDRAELTKKFKKELGVAHCILLAYFGEKDEKPTFLPMSRTFLLRKLSDAVETGDEMMAEILATAGRALSVARESEAVVVLVGLQKNACSIDCIFGKVKMFEEWLNIKGK